MFVSIEKEEVETVTFEFDGQSVSAPCGASIAAALLSAGWRSLRQTPVSNSPRGPFCMMGACFDCLVKIDGVTVQACMTPITEGLVVHQANDPINTPDLADHNSNGSLKVDG